MKKLTVFIVFMALALLLALSAIPVYAIPALPHAFYGSVTINGNPASVGTSVEARGDGVTTGIAGNPLTVTESGQYGGPGGFDPKLAVQGDILGGATITFYVNGVSTGETYLFESGETTELPLSVTIAVPPGPPTPGTEPPYEPIVVETTLFGVPVSFTISPGGKILETIAVTSSDGNLTITIPAGTIALDKDGDPLSTLTMAIDLSPPDPPEDANVIGLTYDFGPDGATFDPPITLEWSYDPNALPEGVAEADLVVAYYDEIIGQWVELPSTVNPVTNTITVSVSHFTCFAIIAAPPPPPPPAPAPPPPTPAPAPPPPTPAPAPVVTPPPPAPTPAPAPVVVPPPPAPVPAPPAPSAVNWTLIIGIIAGVAVVGLLVYLLVFRRRAY